jgi:hypothetical protein
MSSLQMGGSLLNPLFAAAAIRRVLAAQPMENRAET